VLEPHADAAGLVGEASAAVGRGRKGKASTRSRGSDDRDGDAVDFEDEVRAELARAVGAQRVDKYEDRLKNATRAFRVERFDDAARMLRKLATDAPSAASVRELYGLTLYRQGKWKAAAKELEAFRVLTNSTEQHPVLADCYRALRSWAKVDELWDELRSVSPAPELVTEGRIVAAGALADQGKLDEAVKLLAQGWRWPSRPREDHLRRAYALADLYERSGDLPKARELFRRLADADPSDDDVRRRLRNLR
jgi:tetratricopeptide (TPR) repeat protein